MAECTASHASHKIRAAVARKRRTRTAIPPRRTDNRTNDHRRSGLARVPFMGFPPNYDATGDIDSMALLAGEGVGLVRDVKPAGQLVRELVEEARQIIS